MENLTVEERKEKIIELARDDIALILNTNFKGEVRVIETENLIMRGCSIIK